MLQNIAEKEESKKEKDEDIDDETKELEINEKGGVTDMDNDELVVGAGNDAPPHQDAMTITTEATSKEGGDNENVDAEDGNINEAEDTKGGEEGGGFRRLKTATTTKRT